MHTIVYTGALYLVYVYKQCVSLRFLPPVCIQAHIHKCTDLLALFLARAKLSGIQIKRWNELAQLLIDQTVSLLLGRNVCHLYKSSTSSWITQKRMIVGTLALIT